MSYYGEKMTLTMNMPMPHMAMHKTFYWGTDVVILFSFWPGHGGAGVYTVALAVVFLIAVVAELLSRTLNLKQSIGLRAAAWINAVVYAVRMGLVYMVMLSVMSFNGGVFLAAVAGHAVGRYVVRYRETAAVARAVEA